MNTMSNTPMKNVYKFKEVYVINFFLKRRHFFFETNSYSKLFRTFLDKKNTN